MGVHAVSLAVEMVHWPAPSISTLRRSAASSLFRVAKKTQDARVAARYLEENTFFHFHAGPSSERPRPQSPVHVISVKTTVLCSGRLQNPCHSLFERVARRGQQEAGKKLWPIKGVGCRIHHLHRSQHDGRFCHPQSNSY